MTRPVRCASACFSSRAVSRRAASHGRRVGPASRFRTRGGGPADQRRRSAHDRLGGRSSASPGWDGTSRIAGFLSRPGGGGRIGLRRTDRSRAERPARFARVLRSTEHPSNYGAFDIEILAEINSAHRLSRDELLRIARRYRQDGADVIDLGCDPGSTWTGVEEAVRAPAP